MLLDNSIATIFDGTKSGFIKQISRKNALTPFISGSTTYNFKINKYKKEASENGYSFLPAIMESPTGRLHEEFKNLLREISKKKSEESTNIHQSVLYNYYLKRISCVFQKSLSSNFLTRTAQINGKMSALSKTNHIYQYSFISDFHKFDSTRIVEL